jgi:hypothetical protein
MNNIVSDHLSELVDFGGEQVPRGDMINQLYKTAATWTEDKIKQHQLVNAYMGGRIVAESRTVSAQDTV